MELTLNDLETVAELNELSELAEKHFVVENEELSVLSDLPENYVLSKNNLRSLAQVVFPNHSPEVRSHLETLLASRILANL